MRSSFFKATQLSLFLILLSSCGDYKSIHSEGLFNIPSNVEKAQMDGSTVYGLWEHTPPTVKEGPLYVSVRLWVLEKKVFIAKRCFYKNSSSATAEVEVPARISENKVFFLGLREGKAIDPENKINCHLRVTPTYSEVPDIELTSEKGLKVQNFSKFSFNKITN